MRFIGHIKHNSTLIARASAIDKEGSSCDDVAACAMDSMVRDMRRNNSSMYNATSEVDRAKLRSFDKLNQQFGECIKKTMSHGKDALVSVHIRGDEITVVEGVLGDFFHGNDPDMILHFQAMSNESVSEQERALDALMQKK